MTTLVQRLVKLFQQDQGLGDEAFPLDPRLADMMAKTFPVPVVVINRKEDRLHWISPGFLQMSGANPEYLRTSSARAVLERYFTPARALTELLDYGTLQAEVEAILRSEDGSAYDILGVWAGMRLEPTKISDLFLLIFYDVSEEKRLKAELQVYAEELKQQVDELNSMQEAREQLLSELKARAEHLRMLASIAATTSIIALILDPQGHILWVNRAFENRYGYTQAQAAGKHICELPGVPCYLLPDPKQKISDEQCISQRLSPRGIEEEAYYHSPNSESFWAHVTITPVLDEIGEVKYYTVLLTDITERKAREEALRQRTAELEASLRYAARLQRAFLPKNLEGLRPYFKDVGLWYQPLEALGGDFYGYLPVEQGVVVGLGDATGHGVPAALISIYALTSLYEKIKRHGLDLQKTYDELYESIKWFFGEKEGTREGFELALLGYEPATFTAYYLGARRPLWLFRDGEIHMIEGGRMDLASQTLPRSIHALTPTPQTLKLQPGDRLYLFSDALVDQLGGPDLKRFSRSRLSAFLKTNSYLPINELIALLQEALRTFMGEEPQTDDIVFLGLEV